MRRATRVLLVAAWLLLAGWTGAESAAEIVGLERVKGAPVLDVHGETVAYVREVRLNLQSGQVAWVEVASTANLETDEQRYALPWVALEFRPDGTLGTNVAPAKFMPVSERLYYMSDRDFRRQVQNYYGLSPEY